MYEPVSPVPQSSRGHHLGNPSIPPHSLVAFGLFLRLPGYAEVLLKERKKAQCLLRLMLGVTDDGGGGVYRFVLLCSFMSRFTLRPKLFVLCIELLTTVQFEIIESKFICFKELGYFGIFCVKYSLCNLMTTLQGT